VPVAHAIFGVAATINCANYVYFIAFQQAFQLGVRYDRLQEAKRREEEQEEQEEAKEAERESSSSSSSSLQESCAQQVIEVMTTELLNLHRGQGQEIVWRDAVQCPSEEDYCKMVLDKTGGLFRLAVKLMQVFSANKTDFTPLLDKLALYFQIRDDYVNLASLEYMKSKSFCEDLTEGKFSFPIIHCVLSDPQDHRMVNILKQKTEDVEIKTYAVNFMRQTGSLRYTRERIVILRDSLLACIEEDYGGHRDIQGLIVYLDQQLESCDEENGIQTTKVVLETI
jgi:geranylgeranyl diphosphate synthase type 3